MTTRLDNLKALNEHIEKSIDLFHSLDCELYFEKNSGLSKELEILSEWAFNQANLTERRQLQAWNGQQVQASGRR